MDRMVCGRNQMKMLKKKWW